MGGVVSCSQCATDGRTKLELRPYIKEEALHAGCRVFLKSPEDQSLNNGTHSVDKGYVFSDIILSEKIVSAASILFAVIQRQFL